MSDEELRRLERLALQGTEEDRRRLERYELRVGIRSGVDVEALIARVRQEREVSGDPVAAALALLTALPTLAFRTTFEEKDFYSPHTGTRSFLLQRSPPRARVTEDGQERFEVVGDLIYGPFEGSWTQRSEDLEWLGAGPLLSMFFKGGKGPTELSIVPVDGDRLDTNRRTLRSLECDVLAWGHNRGVPQGYGGANFRQQELWIDLDAWPRRYLFDYEFTMAYDQDEKKVSVDYFDFDPDPRIPPGTFTAPGPTS